MRPFRFTSLFVLMFHIGCAEAPFNDTGFVEPLDVEAEEKSLAICSGFWGSYAVAERVENRSSSGYLYEIGSNCYLYPEWYGESSACGGGGGDPMVSFYFGNHAESASALAPMLKVTSSNSCVAGWMSALFPSGLASRVYEQTRGGTRDNYNVYSCVGATRLGLIQTYCGLSGEDVLASLKLRKY